MERIKTNIFFLFSLLAVILTAVSCSDKEAQTALENEVTNRYSCFSTK